MENFVFKYFFQIKENKIKYNSFFIFTLSKFLLTFFAQLVLYSDFIKNRTPNSEIDSG